MFKSRSRIAYENTQDAIERGRMKIKQGIVLFGDPDLIALLRHDRLVDARKEAAKKCNDCRGKGKTEETCSECDGDGKCGECKRECENCTDGVIYEVCHCQEIELSYESEYQPATQTTS